MASDTHSPLREKIGYGLGDMSSSMFWKIFSYYLPIFYSDVFGLRPAHAALLLLVTKLYDAVSDPVMGLIADRTRSRWGRYRPWLLWIAVPFAVVGILSFYTPDTSYGFKHIYAYVTYILMMTVYTAINVPYGAMLGVMTSDSREKSVFSSFRMFFAYVGSFIAMGIFWLFERSIPSGSVGDATPGQWTGVVAIIAGLCAVLFIGCFALTRERVQPAADSKPSSIGKDLKALLRNGPWWLLLGAGIGQLIFGSIRGGGCGAGSAHFLAHRKEGNVHLLPAVYRGGEHCHLVPSGNGGRDVGADCVPGAYLHRDWYKRSAYLVHDGRCCRMVRVENRKRFHRPHLFFFIHGPEVRRSHRRLPPAAGACLVQL